VSVSADHEVKFWDFELVEDASFSKTTKRLGLTHQQTLRMSDSVLALKFSKVCVLSLARDSDPPPPPLLGRPVDVLFWGGRFGRTASFWL
jgi:hypothetical protein